MSISLENRDELETLALNMCEGNAGDTVNLLIITAITRAVLIGAKPESIHTLVGQIILSTQEYLKQRKNKMV